MAVGTQGPPDCVCKSAVTMSARLGFGHRVASGVEPRSLGRVTGLPSGIVHLTLLLLSGQRTIPSGRMRCPSLFWPAALGLRANPSDPLIRRLRPLVKFFSLTGARQSGPLSGTPFSQAPRVPADALRAGIQYPGAGVTVGARRHEDRGFRWNPAEVPGRGIQSPCPTGRDSARAWVDSRTRGRACQAQSREN